MAVLTGTDFFTVEVLSWCGLATDNIATWLDGRTVVAAFSSLATLFSCSGAPYMDSVTKTIERGVRLV